MKLINEEGHTMAQALEEVTKDPALKETWFTTPLALHAAEQPNKYRKGNGKQLGNPHVPAPPKLPKGFERPDRPPKGKTKGKLNGLQLVATTPDGKQICFAFNAQGCSNTSCPRLHVCRVAGCFQQHPAHEHPTAAPAA